MEWARTFFFARASFFSKILRFSLEVKVGGNHVFFVLFVIIIFAPAKKKTSVFPANSTLPEVTKTAHVWNVKKVFFWKGTLKKNRMGLFHAFWVLTSTCRSVQFVACICKRPKRKRTLLLGQMRADCWVLHSITQSITWPNRLSGNF